MDQNIFNKLGFSDKETVIYLEILKLGQAKPGQLSNKTGINRTTVYDLLTDLMQKGLVSKYKKGGASYFNTLEPNKLLNYLDREKDEYFKKIETQKKNIQDALPELSSLFSLESTRPKVKFFEGEKGMREAYEDTLTAKNGIIAYANVATMHKGLPNFFPEYYKRRAKAKIFIRAILPRNKESLARAKLDRQEMRSTKFLPDGKEFTPEVNVYNNKMLVASWQEKIAVIIESKELADLERMNFELVWETLSNKVST